MNDLKTLYQKPIPQIIRELKNEAPEEYDTLGELASKQADWNQADNTKPDFIKNKPTIPDAPGNPLKTITVAALPNSSLQNYTKEQMCSYLDISEAELDALMAGEYIFVNEVVNGHTCTRVTMFEHNVSYMEDDDLLTFAYDSKGNSYNVVVTSLR